MDLINEGLKLLPPSIADLSALEPGNASQDQVVQASIPPVAPVPEIIEPTNELDSSTDDESPSKTSPSSSSPGTAGFNTPLTPWDEKSDPIGFATAKLAASTVSVDDCSSSKQTTEDICSPMSFGQAGFWFLNEYLTDKKVFNMAVMLQLTGSIRVKPLENAIRSIGHRHEILRTRFFWSGEGDDGMPMQGIRQSSEMKLTTKRINSETEAEEELKAVHNETWDLSSGDTMRITLLSLSDQKHFLVFGTHHIFLDGYSFSVFFKDLDTAYHSKPLTPLGPESQYRHFATHQRQLHESGALQKLIEHYRQVIPADLKPIELFPFAKSKERQASDNYGQHEAKVRLGSAVAAGLRQLARRSSSTSFHVYLSALQALVFSLLPGTDDLFIGIADTNRLDKNLMNSIGFFLNLLPLHFHRSGSDATVSSIIRNARDTAYAALQHSQLPFDVLLKELSVGRSNAYTPIFQIFVDYRQVIQERPTFAGCKLDGERWHNASTGYDMALEITESANAETLLSLRLQDTLYSKESTQLLLRSFVNVLEFMVDASDGTIERIPTWSPGDRIAALTAGKGRFCGSSSRQSHMANILQSTNHRDEMETTHHYAPY
jgi:hybrid polyketide synthase/nonribosomal peptide synthetase ACE1